MLIYTLGNIYICTVPAQRIRVVQSCPVTQTQKMKENNKGTMKVTEDCESTVDMNTNVATHVRERYILINTIYLEGTLGGCLCLHSLTSDIFQVMNWIMEI